MNNATSQHQTIPVTYSGAPESMNMTSVPVNTSGAGGAAPTGAATSGMMPGASSGMASYPAGVSTAVPPAVAGAAVAPLQAKGFYVPGAIETEDYTPLRKWHWALFAIFLIQGVILLPLAAPLARGAIPMMTAFGTFDPFRRIYVNQIQDRGYYHPGGELVVVFWVTALMYLINAVFFNKMVRVWDRSGTDYARWLIWSISYGWLAFEIMMVNAMHEIVFTLISTMFLTSTFFWFMMCQDLCNGNPINRRTTFWWPWIFAGIVFAGWLIVFWCYMFSFPFRGVEPRINYAVVIISTFFLLLHWVLQGLQYANVKGFRTFVAQAKWQYGLNFLFQTLIVWLLFAFYIWLFYTVDSNLAGTGQFNPFLLT